MIVNEVGPHLGQGCSFVGLVDEGFSCQREEVDNSCMLRATPWRCTKPSLSSFACCEICWNPANVATVVSLLFDECASRESRVAATESQPRCLLSSVTVVIRLQLGSPQQEQHA